MHEGPVEAAIADYFLQLDRGQNVDVDAIIAAHPGCELEFRQFLAQEHDVQRALADVAPAAAARANMAGRTLDDFQLKRLIGRGGMGVVYEAEQLSLGRNVAVKLLPGALCADARHRMRFQNEARILAQLEHPNIVNVIAVGEADDTYYFAMQYVEGMTADDLIRLWVEKSLHPLTTQSAPSPKDTNGADQGHSTNGDAAGWLASWFSRSANHRDRYRLCARIACDIAQGLAHAHACGVLHRDVKPSNILIDKSGTARLTDFGLARMYGDATLTATGTVLGTLRYASPEQLGGTLAGVDERSDVYSLGATLWELVTAKRLFAAEDRQSVISQRLKTEPPQASSFAAKLPRDLETIITRAMAREPTDRYASAQDFADDLQRFLDGRPILAKPISLGEHAFRWANRNRVLVTSAVGTLVVVALVAVSASLLILRANARTTSALEASQKVRRPPMQAPTRQGSSYMQPIWPWQGPHGIRTSRPRYDCFLIGMRCQNLVPMVPPRKIYAASSGTFWIA